MAEPFTYIPVAGEDQPTQVGGTNGTSIITLKTDDDGNLAGGGTVAHDGVDAGYPLKVGARAIAYGSTPTPVAAADRTNLYADRAGVFFTIGGHPDVLTLRVNATGAQTDVALVTPASGYKIIVTRVKVAASRDNTVNVSVIIGFGAVNTPTGAGALDGHPGIDPGGGFISGNGAGILGAGAVDEALRITNSVPTGGSISCYLTYFTILGA